MSLPVGRSLRREVINGELFGDTLELLDRCPAIHGDVRAGPGGAFEVPAQDRGSLARSYFLEVNDVAMSVTQDRPAAGRANVTHPVGVLAQHRHQVPLALVVRDDDGKGDRPAGPPPLVFKPDEPVRPET